MFERCHSAQEVAYVYRELGLAVSVHLRASVAHRPGRGDDARRARRSRHAVLEEADPVGGDTDRELPTAATGMGFPVGPAWGGKLGANMLTQLEERGVRILESDQRVWLPMTDHPTGGNGCRSR